MSPHMSYDGAKLSTSSKASLMPGSVRCVCVRCGRLKVGLRTRCPACGAAVLENDLELAWLLSGLHLSAEELEAVSQRVISGAPIRPTEAMRRKARAALGRTFKEDRGLPSKVLVLLSATGLVLTPLPAWLLAFWWRKTRPRSALQALFVAACCTLLYLWAVLWVVLG